MLSNFYGRRGHVQQTELAYAVTPTETIPHPSSSLKLFQFCFTPSEMGKTKTSPSIQYIEYGGVMVQCHYIIFSFSDDFLSFVGFSDATGVFTGPSIYSTGISFWNANNLLDPAISYVAFRLFFLCASLCTSLLDLQSFTIDIMQNRASATNFSSRLLMTVLKSLDPNKG